jgi:two-component system CheB/CheR fusion protein
LTSKESRAARSQLKRAEAAQKILLDELQHRVKNVLATFGSLASRMLQGDPSPKQFSAAFQARLAAMGAMHELLAQHRWEGAELRALVTASLAAYADPTKANVSIAGPQLLLKPNTAATLGLALHELATNAAKYGALSAPGGRIEVSWRLETAAPGTWLLLTWMERDGPRVERPATEGFGTSFVKRSIEYELDGTAGFAFNPEGLSVALEIPLSDKPG